MELGPAGAPFLGLLLILFSGCMLLVARGRRPGAQLVAALAALVTGATFGAALVNRHYGYYDSWSSLLASAGDNGTVSLTAAARAMGQAPITAPHGLAGRAGAKAAPNFLSATGQEISASAGVSQMPLRSAYRGRSLVVRLTFSGRASGIRRTGYVYLPPQYRDAAYAQQRFPVVELLHGDPGNAAGWLYALHVRSQMDQLIASGDVGPLVLVIPATTTAPRGQECMDAAHGAHDDTYLTVDVPALLSQLFRVRPAGQGWGIAGLSEGGFCAANLALRHPGEFQAVGSMDGYFSPLHPQRTATALFGGDRSRVDANDPAQLLRDRRRPAPPFWLMAGTRDRGDLTAARSFAELLGRNRASYLLLLPGADHTAPAWRAALPSLLEWMWTTLTGPRPPTGVHVAADRD